MTDLTPSVELDTILGISAPRVGQDLPKQVQWHATRANAVAAAVASGWPVGAQIAVGPTIWQYDGTSTAISDMPGWKPDFIPTPQHWGAAADGVTNDSAAIQAADSYGYGVYFPRGTYAANGLSMTCGWHMSRDAKILYNGATYGEGLRCAVDGLSFGDIYMDLGGLEPFTGFYITGNSNSFGKIHIKNATSTDQTWVVRGIYLVGNTNTIEAIYINDFLNTGNTNDSSPQGLVLSGNANGNLFVLVHGNTTRSTVVDNSSGSNRYITVDNVNCLDNGFYGVGSGSKPVIDTLIYDGINSALGLRHNCAPTIGTIIGRRWANNGDSGLIFFGDCGDVTIGQIIADDVNQGSTRSSMILHSNSAAAGHIKIGSIKANLWDCGPVFLSSANGPIKSLSIDNLDLKVTFTSDPSTGTTPANFMIFEGCTGIKIGTADVNIVLNDDSWASTFRVKFATAMTYASFIGRLRMAVWKADGVTVHANSTILAQGAIQANMRVAEGLLNSAAYLMPYTGSGYTAGQVSSSVIPAAGYHRLGEVIWSAAPTSSLRGWVCTAAGTPGTWSAF